MEHQPSEGGGQSVVFHRLDVFHMSRGPIQIKGQKKAMCSRWQATLDGSIHRRRELLRSVSVSGFHGFPVLTIWRGFGVWGVGCGELGVGFGVWGAGCGAWGFGVYLHFELKNKTRNLKPCSKTETRNPETLLQNRNPKPDTSNLALNPKPVSRNIALKPKPETLNLALNPRPETPKPEILL